jgi:hypothetical protein
MASCSKCGWALGAGPAHPGATGPICQSCALADAELDADVAALAQPTEDDRRQQLVGDFRKGGLEGLAVRHLLTSRESRKIGAFGCIGVLLLGIVAALVADQIEDSAPKLSIASVLEKRKPGVTDALSKMQAVADHAATVADLKAPASDLRDTVVLNLSGQPGDATATILELRQMTGGRPAPHLIFENPRYEGVQLMLAPDFTEASEVQQRIERVQSVKYHAAWIQALQYVVVVRDVAVGTSGLLEGSILIYRLDTAALLGGLPIGTSARHNARVLHGVLAAHFEVFDELGEKVTAN